MLASLRELYRYRVLIHCLVVRELKARYRGSVLGFLWSFLNPLLLMGVYALVFSLYMRIDMENYAVFLFCGLLPWLWFSSSILEGSNAIIAGSSLVKKVLFPPEVLPIVVVLSNLAHFLLGLPIVFLFLIGSGVGISWWALALPVLIVLQLLFTVGLALALSSLSVHLRDITQILANVMTLWFFLCPIIYSLDVVRGVLQAKGLEPLMWSFRLNPMAQLVTAYHDLLFYGRAPGLAGLAGVLAAGLIMLWLGYRVFNRFKWSFSEEV